MPQQQQQQAPRRPVGEWITTWGAIAMGSIDSVTNYGVPTGKMSKAEAEADVLRRCASHGETDCRVVLAYHNQCAVIAEPHINGKPLSGGTVKFVGAATIAEAGEYAKSQCRKENKDKYRLCAVLHWFGKVD